jgi:hypothetical protein
MKPPSSPGDPAERTARLEELLDSIRKRYENLPVPPDALEKLTAKLAADNRELTEEELDWLAAAGAGFGSDDGKKK